jgi:large subunit ribosomal protein L4
MAIPTYTKTGAKATTAATLNETVFGKVPTNHVLLKLAYTAYLANSRENLAVAKNRGDVSGGGKKPWKQKGTGRARVGDNRVPNWRHGGVAFGPTGNENYQITVPVKAKRTALRQALSLSATEGKIRVIETFDATEGKVRKTVELLKKFETTGRVLIAVSQREDMNDRATRNLQGVKVVHAKYLNVYDIMNADTLVLTRDALDIITEWLGVPAEAVASKGDK